MGEEDVFSPEDGKDKEKSSQKHQHCKNRKDAGVEKGKRGMDILQPHHRNIPEQEDEDEKDQASKNQQSDEESLLRFKVQMSLHCGMRHPLPSPPPSRGRGRVRGAIQDPKFHY